MTNLQGLHNFKKNVWLLDELRQIYAKSFALVKQYMPF